MYLCRVPPDLRGLKVPGEILDLLDPRDHKVIQDQRVQQEKKGNKEHQETVDQLVLKEMLERRVRLDHRELLVLRELSESLVLPGSPDQMVQLALP